MSNTTPSFPWKARAAETLRLESEAIAGVIPYLDTAFCEAAEWLLTQRGRLIVTGIGKSAIIAQKLVATLNSTGTPAIFMHAADAIHGDLGLIQKNDGVLCISKSGSSPEIKALVPLIKSLNVPLIGMVGNNQSFLAEHSRWVLHTPVDREACPWDLAPTSSTAVQLAMGDALAICLMEARGFTAQDFAQVHPGGALGKRLYTRLEDILPTDRSPQVTPDDKLTHVALEMSAGRCGAAAVIEDGAIVGMVTDGDLRRAMEQSAPSDMSARDIMNAQPKIMDIQSLAVEAFQRMESASITQIIVTRNGDYVGMVHLHDILKEGIF